jgi:phosphopantetheinyl transferase (holo-ACP synthase)
MTKPIIRIHNTQTNEVIDREMTDAEYADYQAQQAKDVAMTEAIAKAFSDKANATAKLKALGLTADDLKALGL